MGTSVNPADSLRKGNWNPVTPPAPSPLAVRTCLLIFWTLWDQCFLLWKKSVRSDLHHAITSEGCDCGAAKASGRSTDNFRKKGPSVLGSIAVFAPWVPGLSFFLPDLFACGQPRTWHVWRVPSTVQRWWRDCGIFVHTDTNKRSDIKNPQFSMQRKKTPDLLGLKFQAEFHMEISQLWREKAVTC